jgi:ribosomal protein S18 acetylase RimI-like enzyme
MMEIQLCDYNDLDNLAFLNKQLINDENSNNTMNIDELKVRMKGFISSNYNAYLFLDNDVVGYALVDITKTPYYLRQFFVIREQRHKGYGKFALNLLLEELKTSDIDIEVLSSNEQGFAFWQNCGFKEYSRYMKLNR